MIVNDHQPDFATALMSKDLTLAANTLQANGIDGQRGELAAAIYVRFNQTDAQRDFSAIVTDIRNRSDEGDTKCPITRPSWSRPRTASAGSR